MTSPFILKNITAVSSVSRIYRLHFRTISKSTAENSVENRGEIVEDDMPISLRTNPFVKEKRKCILCRLNIEPDYKNVRLLSQFQSRHTGKTYEKHITGLCDHKQRRLEEEILKAQNSGLMGFMTKEPRYVNDPKLFNPNNPFKPHKY